jgi:hypothetical protein
MAAIGIMLLMIELFNFKLIETLENNIGIDTTNITNPTEIGKLLINQNEDDTQIIKSGKGKG